MRQEDLIAQRYAEAIYAYAQERSKIQEVYDILKFFSKIYNQEEQFRDFINSPLIEFSEKEKVVKNILKADDDIEHLIVYILEKNRISLTKNILDEFLRIYYKKNNIVDIKATFTRRLTDEEYERLKKNLEKRTQKEVNLDIIIDKKIIGGGIIKIGDQVIDGSLRKDLQKLKQRTLSQEV